MRNRNFKATGSARDVLGIVFGQLRKLGYLARMNFLCCAGCASYDLATRAAALKDKGKTVNGVVFWHRQDEDRYQESGRLFLRYGKASTQEHGDIGKPTVEVGHEVVNLINKAAAEYAAINARASGREESLVTVQWDGNESSCIEVLDAGLLEREAREEQEHKDRTARWEAERKAYEDAEKARATAFFGEGI